MPALSRPALFAISAGVAAINGFAGKIATAFSTKPVIEALLDLGGVSAIVWFAVYGLFVIAQEGEPAEPRRMDRTVCTLVLALSFIPFNFAAAIGLLLNGVYLAFTSPDRSAARRMAIVMLALTGPLIWGRFLLALMGPELLGLDARLAGLVAGTPVQGNVVELHGGGRLYVALGCSSVHNMSLAVLLFITLTQMLRLRYTRRMVMTGVMAALAMAMVNVLRLAALARFPQYFDLLHTGWGGALFGVLSFVAAGAIIFGGIRAELAR
ncbi:exosortase/archaeosortase family protein [Sphingomonas sp. PR090111-T3T-6A]|uniref:exosortase/archaeosortase family protein n=1 Tax=Sphingomonas sp. PR090111-T3T-6A TaxID=685778 RepID=UPI000367E0D0|nr:exosortase/archaeosortase family protein [Sphingomonas sp. PR090111-T3T-6A]